MNKNKSNIDRRRFLKFLGIGATAATVASCVSSSDPESEGFVSDAQRPIKGKMTYRENPKTKEKVSLLGYGCMRLPTISNESARDSEEEIDQEQVNKLVDYAIKHGVNLFDTSPAYCKGLSERAMGIALKKYPRESYYLSTKLSNFSESTWSREKSIEMYQKSFKELQTDYIDYMHLHGIGMNGMEAYEERYEKNGIREFLMKEREAGRIRNLGFSYHGDIKVFDYLLSKHDEYKWDFCLIQLNYVDWKHAKEVNERNTNAEYLYNELEKRGIPAMVMEPLLGGRLADVNDSIVAKMKQRRPEDSVASWAFRFAGSKPGILSVLSGMTYMEHLHDNIATYSPLEPILDDEYVFLEDMAQFMLNFPTIPCTECAYCMPCPYGLDIPSIFSHYNKCVNEGKMTDDVRNPQYDAARRAFLIGYDRKVPKLRQAGHCISCGACLSHCPQGIAIDKEMKKIHNYVEALKQRKQVTDQVKDKLLAGNLSLVVETANGDVLTFVGRGVKDLYHLYVKSPETLKGAIVADKVIGTGAATLMALGGIKEYYTNVISEDAFRILELKGINGRYGELVAQINNRDGSGRCPLETYLDGCTDSQDVLSRITEFVNSIG